MSIPRRQQRRLDEIGDAICRSDPRLASMAAHFTRLFAADDMPASEQLKQAPLARSRYRSPLPPDPITAAGPSPLPPDRDSHDGLAVPRP